jgi:uncharacterized protein DUF317
VTDSPVLRFDGFEHPRRRQSAAQARSRTVHRPAERAFRHDRRPPTRTAASRRRQPFLGEAVPYTSDAEQWRQYHVTPRYLAGPTFTGEFPLRPFLDLGWKPTHDVRGNIYIASPDQTLRLGYLPEGDGPTLWKITAHSDPFVLPRWRMAFDKRIANEIVRDFTSALATAYAAGPDAYLGHRATAQAGFEAGAPLTAAGWRPHFSVNAASFRSPDGLAEVRLCLKGLDRHADMTDQQRWIATAGQGGIRWRATASSLTPESLVVAMSSAIADTSPVIRYGSDLPLLPPEATVTPVKSDGTLPLDVRRAEVAKSRSATASPHADNRPAIPPQRSGPPPQLPGQRRSR